MRHLPPILPAGPMGWLHDASVAVAVTAALLLVAGTAGAQISTSRVPTAAPPASPSAGDPGSAEEPTGGWSGERRRLEEEGISLGASWVLEGFHNSLGGLKTGTEGAWTLDVNVTLDTERALHWKGGELYFDLEDHAWQNPTADLTGDLQGFDKLNTAPYLQVYELWYQQALFDGRLRLKLGKWDANDDFSVIDNGLMFLDASDIVSPTILAFPTTPDPMPGAAVYVTPGRSWYAQLATFYANRSDVFGDITGHPGSIQPTAHGALFVGETGVRWSHGPLPREDGNLKLGAWGHTGTFTRFDGSRRRGADGYYVILDQTLWRPKGGPEQGRGVRSFVEAGRTQASLSPIDWNAAAGLSWTGPAAARPNDILGFSANYAHVSPRAGLPHSHELALEWFYQSPLRGWAVLHPDVQFIVDPGGQYPDALVGTLDLTIQL